MVARAKSAGGTGGCPLGRSASSVRRAERGQLLLERLSDDGVPVPAQEHGQFGAPDAAQHGLFQTREGFSRLPQGWAHRRLLGLDTTLPPASALCLPLPSQFLIT